MTTREEMALRFAVSIHEVLMYAHIEGKLNGKLKEGNASFSHLDATIIEDAVDMADALIDELAKATPLRTEDQAVIEKML